MTPEDLAARFTLQELEAALKILEGGHHEEP